MFALKSTYPLAKVGAEGIMCELNRLDSQPAIFFVQVGSNDGKSGDPIFPFISRSSKWKGILIEPVPFLFEALKETYRDRKDLVFCNFAISNTSGTTNFYYLPDDIHRKIPNAPEWAPQLGSVSERHISKHLGAEANQFVKTIQIQTVTLFQLLQLHPLPQLDLLHVDAEGHDYNILMGLSELPNKPKIILFEHKHLGFWKMARLLARLRRDYSLMYTDFDVLAIARQDLTKSDLQ